MTETNMINVLIKDGNRTVNWDYYPDRTIWDILRENGFRPVPGTIKVGGVPLTFDPSAHRLSGCPQEVSPDGKQMRVRITLKSQPEKKPVVKKKEEQADVR